MVDEVISVAATAVPEFELVTADAIVEVAPDPLVRVVLAAPAVSVTVTVYTR